MSRGPRVLSLSRSRASARLRDVRRLFAHQRMDAAGPMLCRCRPSAGLRALPAAAPVSALANARFMRSRSRRRLRAAGLDLGAGDAGAEGAGGDALRAAGRAGVAGPAAGGQFRRRLGGVFLQLAFQASLLDPDLAVHGPFGRAARVHPAVNREASGQLIGAQAGAHRGASDSASRQAPDRGASRAGRVALGLGAGAMVVDARPRPAAGAPGDSTGGDAGQALPIAGRGSAGEDWILDQLGRNCGSLNVHEGRIRMAAANKPVWVRWASTLVEGLGCTRFSDLWANLAFSWASPPATAPIYSCFVRLTR